MWEEWLYAHLPQAEEAYNERFLGKEYLWADVCQKKKNWLKEIYDLFETDRILNYEKDNCNDYEFNIGSDSCDRSLCRHC